MSITEIHCILTEAFVPPKKRDLALVQIQITLPIMYSDNRSEHTILPVIVIVTEITIQAFLKHPKSAWTLAQEPWRAVLRPPFWKAITVSIFIRPQRCAVSLWFHHRFNIVVFVVCVKKFILKKRSSKAIFLCVDRHLIWHQVRWPFDEISKSVKVTIWVF